MPPIDSVLNRYPWLPYVAPFALFIALTAIEPGGTGVRVWTYPVKTVVVAITLVVLWRGLPPLIVRHSALAGLVGLITFVIWILPEGLYPYLGTPETFDPFANIAVPWVYGWIAFRLVGATVVVPIMEEFFWRGFLIRWIINDDFRKVPMGAFSWPSFLLTTILFASEHNRWLVGLVAGVAYNLLLYRTKSLYACIVAHGVTNLALAIYVLAAGEWSFW